MLMKQPEREDDSDNPARATFGGAAPKEIWEDFEKRFNVTIVEGSRGSRVAFFKAEEFNGVYIEQVQKQ